MKSDQDLIFEAYAKTFNENYKEYHNDELIVNGDEYIVQAIVSGDDVEITTLFKYDKELDDHNEIDLGSISPQLRQDIEDSVLKDAEEDNESRAKNIQRGQEAISAAQEEYYKQFGAEAFEDHYGFPYPHAEDNENYASEGAVNLLEQLKREVPELEDEINQILEKVFEAVDILKQESYADDPQLVKAYASLIEGDF